MSIAANVAVRKTNKLQALIVDERPGALALIQKGITP